MKRQIALIVASVTLFITGTTLKASAFEAHTSTSNFNEYRLGNTPYKKNLGGKQDSLLLNKDAVRLEANNRRPCRSLRCVIKDDIKNIQPGGNIEQTYAKYRARNSRGKIRTLKG